MLIEVAAALVVSGFLLLVIGIFIARQYTLRAKLVTAFLVIVLISLAVLAVLDSYIMKENLTDSANNVLSSTARHYAERIDRFNAQNIEFLETEADMPVIKNFIRLRAEPPFERQTLLEILRALESRQNETIKSYAILDKQGINILDTVQDNTGADESGHDYFKVPVKEKSSGSFRSLVLFEDGRPCIVFSSAIKDLSGKVIGVLRAKYDASILFSLIDRTKNMVGRGSFVILLDENQQRLVHGRRSNLNFTLSRQLDKITIEQLIAQKRLLPGTSNRYIEKPEWLDRIMAASVSNPIIETQFYGLGTMVFSSAVVNLETAPWTIIVSLPQDVFLEPVVAQTQSAFLLVAAIILVVFLIVMAATQLLLGPVKRLTAVVKKISSGDLKAKAKVEANDEIGGLADAFNEMTRSISNLISERINHEKELWHQANYDQLTGLPNRTRVNRLIEKEIDAARPENKKIALLYMDFDHFKNINDTLGHESGDEFLKYMSGRLQACVRNTDTVARLGGDEFLIMLIETAAEDNHESMEFDDIVKAKAEEILRSVSQPSVIDDMEFSVTASIGIAIYPQDGDVPFKLLKNADTAMYRSKRKGRNTYQM
ncbi:MAG: diguanylate cyclase, partial [Proteobacteria bacterium]|nr:diguanylate cyclase [Pseudomonadota bacterium]